MPGKEKPRRDIALQHLDVAMQYKEKI